MGPYYLMARAIKWGDFVRSMVLDLETTGLADPIDIVQLSYLIFDDETHEILEPGVSKFFLPSRTEITPGAYCVSGISEEYLYTVTDSSFEDFISDIKETLKSVDIIIGHNITGFDLRVIRSYNDTELNSILDNICIVDTMKDFIGKLNKLICLEKGSELARSYLKLVECYYHLLREGADIHKIDEGFKKAFPNIDSKFHNASFDVYITYLTYNYAKYGVIAC